MGQREEQSRFVRAMGRLITLAYDLGYELTLGDTYPSLHPHKPGSFHGKGLAVDLNLFREGVYLTRTEDHQALGEIWESLGGTWGGRFASPDGNHYSWGEGRKK